jgi:hypothetical protein
MAVIALGHKFACLLNFFAYVGPLFKSLGVAHWCRVCARAFGSLLEWQGLIGGGGGGQGGTRGHAHEALGMQTGVDFRPVLLTTVCSLLAVRVVIDHPRWPFEFLAQFHDRGLV